MRYKITRRFQNSEHDPIVIGYVNTREEAEAHCTSPETSSFTCTDPAKVAYTKEMGNWFDSFTYEGDGHEHSDGDDYSYTPHQAGAG